MEHETFVDLEKWPYYTEADGKISQDHEMGVFSSAFEKGGLEEAASKIKEHLQILENASLDIAIAGESSCGKSTFINSFRGVRDEGESSAKTGVVDSTTDPTTDPTAYPHPKYPKVTLWDLPGISTHDCPATYLQQVNVNKYDVFLIMASECFRDYHVQLACDLKASGKRFFFVRSKVDIDVDSNRRCKSANDEGGHLQEVRQNCMSCLAKQGVETPPVYLLSCFDLGKFEFKLLAAALENELPSHKKHIFILSLPNVSLNILEQKRGALRKQIWKFAMVSCIIAALPVPGLSVVCDIAILVKSLSSYRKTFDLDDLTLGQLAAKARKPVVELKNVLRSPLAHELSADLVEKLLAKAAVGGMTVAEAVLRHIPVFGSLAAAGISFGTTYCMLKSSLDEMAEDAKRILTKALKEEASGF